MLWRLVCVEPGCAPAAEHSPPVGVAAAGELLGEEQVGELRLPVRAPGAVLPLGLQVVEVHPADARRGAAQRHHPRRIGPPDEREQPGRQREVAEHVGAELELEPVGGLLAGGHGHDPGVVHQDVDGLVTRRHQLRELLDRREARQVELLGDDARVRRALADVGDGLGGLGRVAAREHDLRVRHREPARGLQPDAAVRSGDDGELAVLVGEVDVPGLRHEVPTVARRQPGRARASRRGSGRTSTATSRGCRGRRGTSSGSRSPRSVFFAASTRAASNASSRRRRRADLAALARSAAARSSCMM